MEIPHTSFKTVLLIYLTFFEKDTFDTLSPLAIVLQEFLVHQEREFHNTIILLKRFMVFNTFKYRQTTLDYRIHSLLLNQYVILKISKVVLCSKQNSFRTFIVQKVIQHGVIFIESLGLEEMLQPSPVPNPCNG